MSAVDEALGVAFLEESPDGVVVLVGEGEVAAAILRRAQLADDFARPRGFGPAAGQIRRDHAIAVFERVAQQEQHSRVIPIAPVTQANGLLGLPRGEGQHALLASAHEFLDAVIVYLALGPESQALLDLDLNPQSLAIEPVLVTQRVPVHSVVALVHIFQRPPPRVMHAHRIIGRYRPVEERPARAIRRLPAQLVENAVLLPEEQDVALHGREIGNSRNRFIHAQGSVRPEETKSQPIFQCSICVNERDWGKTRVTDGVFVQHCAHDRSHSL